jgi:predicted aspartyl protease
MGPTLEDKELSTLFEPTEGLHQLTNADSKLLVFEGEVAGRKVSILIDSGASTQFMSERLAKELMLPLTEKKVGNAVSLANGTIVRSGHYLAFR